MNVRSARTFCVIVAIVITKNEFLAEKVGGRFIGLYRYRIGILWDFREK